MSFIQCQDVSRCYTSGQGECFALLNVSFAIEAGEFVAVVGPSGSGKTTLLNLLGGLDRATDGAIVIDGLDLCRASEHDLDAHRRDRVGFIFQSFHLNARRTAMENITLPLAFSPHGSRSAPDTHPAPRCLHDVSLAPFADRRVSTLSGGQRQRVAIARALVRNPSLLLADEPVGNLDAAAGRDIVELLLSINREKEVTIIAASHDEMLLSAATRTLELRDGRLAPRAQGGT